MLHVIFDRSAFHQGENFDLLSTSQLQALCHGRKLSVAHTPIFLEETLRMYGNPRRREQLRQQMPFILDICNGGIYHNTETIWQRELILNHGTSADIFLSEERQQRLKQRIRTGVLEEDWSAWRPSLWDDIYGKKKAQRAFYRGARLELPRLHRRSFTEYLASSLDSTGRAIIQYHVEASNNGSLQDNWSSNKEHYPFITAYAKGVVYAEYYATFEQNMPLDTNAQTDYGLMTYLTHADILIAADKGFLRSAFVELWEPHRKKLFTPEEFVTFIDRL